YRELDDKRWIVYSLLTLARVAHAQGDDTKARALLEEALAAAREVEDQSQVCVFQGDLHLELGDYAAARSRYEVGLALRRRDDHAGIARSLLKLGHAAWLQGEPSVAQSQAVEALGLSQAHEYREGLLAGLELLAVAALAQGRKERAARLLGAVAA